MNTETKRHIDAARQVLVGVVPNPTSQIDQITNALIYKFMDDMDQAAIKAGGEPSFFVGDLEQYAWTRLMDTRMGNQERMNLYAEALLKFSEAKQLPELFRGIFKSAFLPYRSPETLGLFLKEIDYFDYSHPEELGNAYEYLLSIMSSQGDAGQFRTPRHIIDFIVAVVNPTKDDKILDPACGTGGFLVSSYRHILEQHDGKGESGAKEKTLTPDERRKLMANFEGYDVDPGMQRIAQVNMYLHQFKNPKIYQYNTLADEERWSDKFDIILANPPFMSPKGAGKPHSKFGIDSSRSEVLFVDYIMNHLRPKGRAGIIVPEGLIFKSDIATKQLRKNLVEDGLYAVVSLPSGVFNPYAGVKTSIFLFDNNRAKETDELLFVKIESDGYDLGAQRRPINKNDLPEALEVLAAWRNDEKKESSLAQWVAKAKVAETGDYNLSASHYVDGPDHSNIEWDMVALEDVLEYEQPTPYIVDSVDYDESYKTPVLTAGKSFILGYTHETHGIFCEGLPVIIFDDFTTATKLVNFPFKVKSSAMKILKADNKKADVRYVFHAMQHIDFVPGEHKRYWISQYSKIRIPLPPFDVQQRIVAELDGYQKIINGARQVVDNWGPRIDIDPEWRTVRLGDVCFVLNGYAFKSENYVDNGVRIIRITNVQKGEIVDDNPKFYPSDTKEPIEKYKLFDGDLLISLTGNVGRVGLLQDELLPAALNQRVACLRVNDEKINLGFLFASLNTDDFETECIKASSGVAQKNLSTVWLSKYEIHFPPLGIQNQIVEKIEAERALVDSTKKLIDIYEQKTKETIAKLWNE